jgi:hypothetical protein
MAILAGFSAVAKSAMFVWSAPTPITTAEATLNVPGTIAGAEVFGPAEKVVVLPDNTTIDFKADGSVATLINATTPFGPGVSTGAFSGNTGNRDFDSVLTQFSYDGGPKTITLYNLKVGRPYSVQLFALDDRTNSGEIERRVSFRDANHPDNACTEYKMGANCYVLGTFTAPDAGDGSSSVNVVVGENLPDGGIGNINALVVRDLGSALLPRITGQPRDATAYAGGNVKLAVVAIAKAPNCQWQAKGMGRRGFTNIVDGGNISGSKTTQLVIANLTEANSADYRVVLTNPAGSVTSDTATLAVVPVPPPLTDPFASAVMASRPIAYWRLNESQSNQAFYDFAGGHHLVNHGVVLGEPGLQAPGYPGFSNTNTAAFFDGQNSAATSGLSLMNGLTNYTVMGWFNPAGFQNGTRVGLFGQNDVFELGYNDAHGINLFLQVANSRDWFYAATGTNGFATGQWSFTAVVANGNDIDIYVNDSLRLHQANTGPPVGLSNDGFNVGGGGVLDPSGNCFYGAIEDVAVFDKALAPETIHRLYRTAAGIVAPTIILPPQSLARYLGAEVQFTVTAEGTSPLSYQWQVASAASDGFADLKDAGGYSGVTTAKLTIANLKLNQVGGYRVLVSNPGGSTPSSVITLAALSETPKFTWSGPTSITTAEAALNLPGTIVGAEVFGATPKRVILDNRSVIDFQTNGTVATVTNGSRAWAGSGVSTGAFSSTSGNRDFDAVLSQYDHDGGPKHIGLHGLVPGRRYSVQLFALDDRVGDPATRLASFQDPDDANDLSPYFAMSDNAYVVATFTAPGADVVIQENLLTGNRGNINALVLRDLSATVR